MTNGPRTYNRRVKAGLILFAHGARDARWAEPFERLRDRVVRATPHVQVVLAFLELMAPDLDAAAAALCDSGCRAITVVPVFLGQGGHLLRDLPLLVDQLRIDHPGVAVKVTGAVGEDPAVLDAMTEFCVRSLG